VVLSTFNPLPGIADGDAGSLRAAILAANANAEADTIQLDVGTYALTAAGGGDTLGDLDLTDTAHKITIIGAGAGDTIIDATALSDRVFDINSDVTVEFVGVTITGGTGPYGADGAGILNAGTLTMQDSVVSGNAPDRAQGGGIYNTGDATLNGTTVSDNLANDGAGIWNEGTLSLQNSIVAENVSGNSGRNGGGIYNTGVLTLNASEVSGNSGREGGGIWSNGTLDVIGSTVLANTGTYRGAGIASSGALQVIDSTISHNASDENGGGIYNYASGAVAIVQTTISENSAYRGAGVYSAGELSLDDVTLSQNEAERDGGGVHNASTGTLSVTDSTFSENTALTYHGGGIRSESTEPVTVANSLFSENTANRFGGGISGRVDITDSRFENNTALREGGAMAGSGVVTNSIFTGNSARGGGAIVHGGSDMLTIVDCTISNNTAAGLHGGGIHNGSGSPLTVIDTTISGNSANVSGGGVFTYDTRDEAVTLTNVTLSGNSARTGGGMAGSGTVTLTDCVVSDNTASTDGGGLSGVYSIINSVISNNTAAARGGGFSGGGSIAGSTILGNTAGTNGGGIHGGGTITESTITGNTASYGGGIFAVGDLYLDATTIAQNTAINNGGGIYGDGTLTGCTITDNTAGNNGGGLSGGYSLINTEISNNRADSAGGGIDLRGTTTGGIITGNTAGINGGGVYASDGESGLLDTTITGNTAVVAGGGIYNNHSRLAIAGASLLDNQAPLGGGIFNQFRTTIDDSVIFGNQANTGAGIYQNYKLTVNGTTISENVADEDGGGIANNGSGLTINDSTLSANTSGRDGGGIFNNGNKPLTVTGTTFSGNDAVFSGGGVFSRSTYRLEFTNTTLSGNSAAHGGGLFTEANTTLTNSTITDNTAALDAGGVYTSRILTMANTILAGNTAVNAPDGLNTRTITSLGHNLIGNDTSFPFLPGPGDLVGTAGSPIDPLLSPLADNGGPTWTHALLLGSPAFDAGDNDLVPVDIDFDQRGDGFPRIIDGDGDGTATIDIGAFESELLNQAPVAVDDTPTVNEDMPSDIDVLANDSDPDPGDSISVSSIDTTETLGQVALNPDGTIQYDPNGLFEYLAAGETATDTFSYTISDNFGESDTAIVAVTVTGMNDAPIVDAGADQTADEGASVDFVGSFTDVDVNNTHSIAWDFGDGTSLQGKRWATEDGGNGNFYTVIRAENGITWDDAAAAATAAGGHLATITSAEENAFAFDLIEGDTQYWAAKTWGDHQTYYAGPWLGGFKSPATEDPAANWHWVTGETWGYTYWCPEFPNIPDNTGGNQDKLHYLYPSGGWNDLENDGYASAPIPETILPIAYVVEWEDDGSTLPVSHAYDDDGTYTVALTVTDNDGASTSDTLTVTANNVAPVAVADNVATDEDTPLMFNILANDTDAGTSDVLSAVADSFTTNQGAAVTILSDGTTTYNPDGQFEYLGAGETATDTFTYLVQDDDGGSDEGTVTVMIAGANDGPTVGADDDSVTVDEGDSAENTGIFDDVDLSDNVTITASIGTITQGTGHSGTWSWSFDTSDGPDDTQVVTITATDSDGAATPATFELVVDNVDPSAAISGPAEGLKGDPLPFDLSATDVSVVDQAANFTYVVNWGDGSPIQTIVGAAAIEVDHEFIAAGSTTVIVTAMDKDLGVSDPVSFQIDVIQPVVVDVKPGNDQNKVNAKSQGVIPVAIYTTADFDATTISGNTVRLAGVMADHFVLEDVDGDGDLDLILHFRTQEVLEALGLDLSSGEPETVNAELTGETVDEVMIEGFDMIDFFLPGSGKGKKK